MNIKKVFTNKINIIMLACIACFLWGSAYPAIKIGYQVFNIETNDISTKILFAGYRFALAGLMVLILEAARIKAFPKLTLKELRQVSCLGIFQTTFQYILFYIGLSYTTGIRSSILNGTGTFFSIIIAHFLYKDDKINRDKIIGCLIGFAGVITISLNGENFFGDSFKIYGDGFVIMAAFLSSASAIYSKTLTKTMSTVSVTGWQLFIGGIILTLTGIISGGHLTGFSAKSVMLLIYMAFISSAAFAIWTELLKWNKVGFISMFNFLIPVFGTILSAVFLGENLFDIKILISLVLVCCGIFFVYRKK